jgi:hypothetical protein
MGSEIKRSFIQKNFWLPRRPKTYCLLAFIPFFLMTIFDKPAKTIVRGPIVLRQYYHAGWIGGHAQWPWTITIDGKRFSLPNGGQKEFSSCYTGPNKEIAVVLIQEGKDWYLLRVVDGQTDLITLRIISYDSRSWTEDGRSLVLKGKNINARLDVLTGAMTKLPAYPERFLCFSPDGRIIVSVETREIDGVFFRIVYQTDMLTGKTEQDVLKAADYPWLGEWTYYTKYESSPNIWIASHFRWVKESDGIYKLLIQ